MANMEVINLPLMLKAQKEKLEKDIASKDAQIKSLRDEIEKKMASRPTAIKARKRAENQAYDTATKITSINMEIYGLQRQIAENEIDIDQLNWELSKISLFNLASRKKKTALVEEKKNQLVEYNAKIEELNAKKEELQALPTYEETIQKFEEEKEVRDAEMAERQDLLRECEEKRDMLAADLGPLDEKIAEAEVKAAAERLIYEEEERLRMEEERKQEEEARRLEEEARKLEEESGMLREMTDPRAMRMAADDEEEEEEEDDGERHINPQATNLDGTAPRYAPGEEPDGVKQLVDDLLIDLDIAYPNYVVSGLNTLHRRLGKKVTDMYRLLGYNSGNEFLAAYGYTTKRRKAWGDI